MTEPPPPRRLPIAYSVFGLVGFLSQMVVAMKGRLLPLLAWYSAFASGNQASIPSPHAMAWRPGQYVVFALWVLGPHWRVDSRSTLLRWFAWRPRPCWPPRYSTLPKPS